MIAATPYDLHMHTHYSDGVTSPEELVRHAASIGLKAIAITDHDNTRGSREAQPLARELGLTLIPAIEFGTRWPGYGWKDWAYVVDLLGYFVDWDIPAFRALEEAMLAEYLVQFAQTCEVAQRRGYPVTLGEAAAVNPRYPSVYTLVDVLREKGLADDGETALYHMVECWNEVCEFKFTIDRVIETIHAAGGVAVLAHPSVVLRPDGEWIREEDLARLVDMGLDGIEVYHYRLPDERTRQHFLALARHFDLAVTGGSDEHGRQGGFTRMGQQPITGEMVAALQARCRRGQ
jgi:hypothetical protein